MNHLKYDAEVLRRKCYSYAFSLELVLDRISQVIDRLDEYLWFSKESIVNGRINDFSKKGISIGVYRTVTDFMDEALGMLNDSVDKYTDTLNRMEEKLSKDYIEVTSNFMDTGEIFNKSIASSFTRTKLNHAGINLKRVMRVFYYYAENFNYNLNYPVNYTLNEWNHNIKIDYETVKFLKDSIKVIKHITKKYEIVFSIFREEHPEEEERLKEVKEESSAKQDENSQQDKHKTNDYKSYHKMNRKKSLEEKVKESYTILKIPVGSPMEEVKRAYKSMVKKCHPDLFCNNDSKRIKAEELTSLLNRAYEELINYFTGIL
jgi:hypothetical protein